MEVRGSQEFLNVYKMNEPIIILGKRASQKEQVRKRLMKEALLLFSKRGLEKTTVADIVPLRLFDWLVAIEPEKELVLEALPPNPAKFLKMPVPPTSAPILSAFADEFVTALLDEKVSLKVTDKMSPTFFDLLSEEKRPEELVLYIEPLDGSALSNSSNDGLNGLNCWLFASST